MSDKMSASEPIGPLQVTVIGTGDGKLIDTGTVGTTPKGAPNMIVTVVTPVVALLVRFIYAYLSALVGMVMAGMSTTIIPWTDFTDLLMKCLTLSLAGPVIALLKDLITIFGRLEHKFPLASGSV